MTRYSRMKTRNSANGTRRVHQALLAAVVMAAAVLFTGTSLAQEKTASIHGHVNNEVGALIPNATVRFTKDATTDPKKAKWLYTFPVDASGDYKGTGIAPDKYLVVVVVGDSSLDYFQDQTFKASEDKLLNFDMSRKEFLDKLTPERKQQIEDFKKKQADALSANKTVGNLNSLLKQAREANAAGKYDEGVAAMTTATQQAPTEPILWVTLGNSQLGIADAAYKAAKTAKTPTNDPAIVADYTTAAASFKKAVDLNAASKKPSNDLAGTTEDLLGTSLGKSGDLAGSGAAFDAAAKADPPNAPRYYLNEAVIYYNASKPDEAAAAADKAIAADPKKADAYYIKGQALIQKVTVDAAGKVVAPPGCVDAYQTYLELAPDGVHAQDVKGILTGIGETVKSSYKAGKKKS